MIITIFLLFRVLLFFGPLFFYKHGAQPLVVLYMVFNLCTLILLTMSYINENRLIVAVHILSFLLAFTFSTLTLLFPIFHSVSIILAIDLFIDYNFNASKWSENDLPEY